MDYSSSSVFHFDIFQNPSLTNTYLKCSLISKALANAAGHLGHGTLSVLCWLWIWYFNILGVSHFRPHIWHICCRFCNKKNTMSESCNVVSSLVKTFFIRRREVYEVWFLELLVSKGLVNAVYMNVYLSCNLQKYNITILSLLFWKILTFSCCVLIWFLNATLDFNFLLQCGQNTIFLPANI